MLIPQGMAYALIAGLPPVYGLYASIVPQIIYAILGTSRQLSVAPVAMDSLMVAAGVSVLATEGTESYILYAILLAFFMGLFQLLLGTLRLGFITNLLSKPVISGFTSAAAIIIGLNQLKYLLGVDIVKSNKVYEVIWNAIQQIGNTHWQTLLIGVAGIAIIKGVKRIHSKIPGALVAVIMGVVVVSAFGLHESGVNIVREIPKGLPGFQLPDFSLGQLGKIIPLALTISVVAFMESYSVAKAIESKKKNYKVVPNQELLALGAANLIGSLFQSYPVTGGFSRSAVNYQAGAHTPIASLISAGLIVVTLLFLTPLFYYLPTAILASVIMVAIVGLIDFSYAKKLWTTNKVEFALLLATFLVTLNFSMVPGIVTGVALSILVLLYRAAYPHIAILGRLKHGREFRNVKRFEGLTVWKHVAILRLDAPLNFVNIQFFKEYIEGLLADEEREIKNIVIDAHPISYIDATASEGLLEIIRSTRENNIGFSVANLIGPLRDSFFQLGLIDEIGDHNIYLNLNEALESIETGKNSELQKYALQAGYVT